MKRIILFAVLFYYSFTSFAQSNPVVLKPGISINRIMSIRDGAIRVERDETDNQLYYILTTGEIYKVIIPQVGLPYDSLVASVTEHGVQYVQGMVFHDSTWYVSGNNNSNTPLTYGIIVRGKLQPNGSRTWDTLMHTANYETNGPFDHLFSGITLSPTGDSVYIASGARGDHGEIETRNGMYPNLRNTPLTTNIFAMPTQDPNIITLQNDSTWLANSGYLYARGIRNHFDMAFDQHGNLFALENSGDRDHNEEMNWIRQGRHYGFPWIMGDTYNPQQYTWFDPLTDLLINHNSRTWRLNAWSNDPAFPPPPAGITFESPLQNFGPDCDKYKDTLGHVHDASDEGISIGTFTAHRSPLGLVFDNDNVLGPLYRGDAFMFSWTPGYDSTGSPPPPDSTHIGPFVDSSQDMVHLDLMYDSIAGNFSLHATRIIGDFISPVDAEIDSNVVYLIENAYDGNAGLYAIHLPVPEYPCQPTVNISSPDICHPDSNTIVIAPFGALPDYISWYDTAGTLLRADTVTDSDTLLNMPVGVYYISTMDGGACGVDSAGFSIMPPVNCVIDSIHHTTCIGCADGEIFFSATGGIPPYTYAPNPAGLMQGVYYFCVSDVNGCGSCDTVTIMEDPTGIPGTIESVISVFPNPLNNRAQIIFDGAVDGIEIFDAKGKEVTSHKISLADGKMMLDASAMHAGNYSIRITSGNKFFNKNIVIIR